MITIGLVDILLGSMWLYIYRIDKSNKLVLYNSIVFICTGIINVDSKRITDIVVLYIKTLITPNTTFTELINLIN